MKKSLLISLIVLSGILFTACGKKSEKVVDNNQPTGIAVESDDCEKVIKKYLDGVDKKGSGDEVKTGDNVTVDYIGRLEGGMVFETTIRSIAEACDIYDESIDYTQGYEFNVGAGQMIKGFDEGVIGMKIGQTKTVQFGPEEGYGEYDKTKVEKFTSNDIGDLSKYEVGMIFQKSYYEIGVITSVTDNEMIVDFNHELAGKTLIFDITLKAIN